MKTLIETEAIDWGRYLAFVWIYSSAIVFYSKSRAFPFGQALCEKIDGIALRRYDKSHDEIAFTRYQNEPPRVPKNLS